MKNLGLHKLSFAGNNKTLVLITSSFITILIIFLNLGFIHSPIIGFAASILYLSTNSILLGSALSEKEHPMLGLLFGILLLITLLGFVGWLMIIIHNLDIPRLVITLSIVSVLSSLIGLKRKREQWDLKSRILSQLRTPKRFDIPRVLYLSMIVLSFFLLFLSRSGEVHIVWDVMHPLFIPIFFATTLLLLMIIFSSEKGEYKLFFIILHSILSHSFFAIIFPAGDVGYQARILADSRLVFNNALLHGWPPWPVESVPLRIWYLFRGINYQSALSVAFAHMFNVDIYWSHSFLVPILWGIFIPVATFKVTKKLTANENISFLSGFIISLFPSTIYYGALSIPNDLGYIFFFFSLFFMMEYLSSQERKTLFLTVTFSFASFMSHYLAGAMSFTLLLLVIALRRYQYEKDKSPFSAKLLLLSSFIFCTCIIPFALIYQRFFYPFRTHFGLDQLQGLGLEEVVQWFLFGAYTNYWLLARIFHITAPVLGFLGMIYLLIRSRKEGTNKKRSLYLLFLSLSFLITLVDYRILKLFMVRVPFNEERLWVFRDFLATPFVAIFIERLFTFLQGTSSNVVNRIRSLSLPKPLTHPKLKSVATYILAVLSLSFYLITLLSIPAGIAISLYYGYPRYAPLQITSYELEAVKYIQENTNEKYVVIADYWMITAGQMLVGVTNPNAYYFKPRDSQGVALFVEMKDNPTNETMIEAMKTNNATTAYFIIGEPRLGSEEYDRIIQQARKNGLPVYRVFPYKGEEKLTVFYYEEPPSTE